MVEHRDAEFARFGLSFNGLWGRRLQAIDCQGLFFETDKYCRGGAESGQLSETNQGAFSATPELGRVILPAEVGHQLLFTQ